MTNEEAYKWLHVHFAPCGDGTKQDEAINVALKALGKQIPKKPIPKKPIMIQNRYDKKLWYLDCPYCGNHIGMRDSRLMREDIYNNTNKNICLCCGQAIDCTGVE